MTSILYNQHILYNAHFPYQGGLPEVPPELVLPAATYDVIICGRTGMLDVKSEWDNAIVNSVVKESNGLWAASVSMPTADPKALDLKAIYLLKREIQIWRNGKLYWWGIPLRFKAGPVTTTWQCVGLLWYFSRRLMGPTPTIVGFSNGNFDAGFSGWTAHNGANGSISTQKRARRAQSARLDCNVGGADTYIEFVFDYLAAAGSAEEGGFLEFHIPGWRYVEKLNEPAWEERGLYAQCEYPIGTTFHETWSNMSLNDASDDFVRDEVVLQVSRGTTDHLNRIKIRCYVGDGVVFWGALNCVIQRSVGANGAEVIDNSVILSRLITYAGGMNAEAIGLGKSSLNMGLIIPLSGTSDTRRYGLESNEEILGLLTEFQKRNIYDVEATWNSAGTARQIEFFTSPKGQTRHDLSVELGRNLVDISDDVDASGVTTAFRALGRGRGVSQEWAESKDTLMLDGLVLEASEVVPEYVPLRSLDSYASAQLARARQPVEIPGVIVADVKNQPVIDYLGMGDFFTVTCQYGTIDINRDFRAVRSELSPANGDTLEVNVNAP